MLYMFNFVVIFNHNLFSFVLILFIYCVAYFFNCGYLIILFLSEIARTRNASSYQGDSSSQFEDACSVLVELRGVDGGRVAVEMEETHDLKVRLSGFIDICAE